MRNMTFITLASLIILTILTSTALVVDVWQTDSESDNESVSTSTASFLIDDTKSTDFDYGSSNNAVTITGYNGGGGHVIIPDSIEGMPVKYILDSAFKDKAEINSIILPKDLISIGGSAFRNCTGITHVDIPDGVSVIGNSAFRGCSGLTEVIFGSNVSKIQSSAFRDCISLDVMQFKGNAPDTSTDWNVSVSKEFKVYYAKGKTGFDNSWSVNKIELDKPGAPKNLNIIPSAEKLHLSWAAPVFVNENMVFSYEVFFKTIGDKNWTCIHNINELDFVLEELENGTEYESCVAAVNIAGTGDCSNIVSSIPSTVPEPPDAIGKSMDAEVMLTWNVPENGGAEIIEYYIYQDGTRVSTEHITNTSYRIGGLQNGINYFFQITALNYNGEGLKSNSVSITPMKVCTINFDTNGGNQIDSITQIHNTKVLPPNNPQKEGSTFIGWIPALPDLMPQSDMTIVAVWNINIDVPSAVFDIYYNGFDQVGIVTGTGYILSGNFAMKDVGTYKAYAMLEEGYIWLDGESEIKEIEWSIMPKEVIVTPVNNQTKIFSQKDSPMSYSLSEEIFVTGELSRDAGEGIGEYCINLGNMYADQNYILKLAGSDIYFKINPKCISKTFIDSIDDEVYTGSEINPGIFVMDDGTVLVPDSDYTISFHDNVSAGTASVIVSGMNNYSDSIFTDFTIVPKTMTIKADDKSVIYSKDAPTYTARYDGFVQGEDKECLLGALSFMCDYDGTVYNRSFSIKPLGLSSTNYEITFLTGELLVYKAIATEPTINAGLFYNGYEQVGVTADVGYSLTNNRTTDAGEYMAIAVLKDGYVWHDQTSSIRTVSWTILPKVIQITPESGQSKTYWGDEPVLRYRLSEDIDILGRLDRVTGEEIGEYAITIGTLVPTNKNYDLRICEQTITMEIVATCPGNPIEVETELDGHDLKLSWCAPIFDGGSKIMKYEVWVNINNIESWILLDIANNPKSSIINIEEGVYDFSIKAVNDIGTSDFSSISSISITYDENMDDYTFALFMSIIFMGFNLITILLFRKS